MQKIRHYCNNDSPFYSKNKAKPKNDDAPWCFSGGYRLIHGMGSLTKVTKIMSLWESGVVLPPIFVLGNKQLTGVHRSCANDMMVTVAQLSGDEPPGLIPIFDIVDVCPRKLVEKISEKIGTEGGWWTIQQTLHAWLVCVHDFPPEILERLDVNEESDNNERLC